MARRGDGCQQWRGGGTAPAVDENADHLTGGGVAAHHDVGVAALLQVRFKTALQAAHLPRFGTLQSPSPQIHRMMWYSKPLKYNSERV
jgi:hypothetical protein